MSKRKTMDKGQARDRRNQLLASAAAADLSLTEGVREMRAIAGMTQEEFARHREVSARVIKAIELGQGNPTVATLNRIGQFFGLEVGFVPVRRTPAAEVLPPDDAWASSVWRSEVFPQLGELMASDQFRSALTEGIRASLREIGGTIALPGNHDLEAGPLPATSNEPIGSRASNGPTTQGAPGEAVKHAATSRKKRNIP